MILEIALALSVVLNVYLHTKRPIKHIRVEQKMQGVFARTLRTRK